MLNPYLKNLRDYPLKLIVDIHSYCNARCTMCPYPRYAARQSQGKMSRDLYERIIHEFAAIGREHHFRPQLTYCYMGEPFLADDLDCYVKAALDSGIDVYLNTNAAAMTPKKVDALLATGFKGKIHVSFHGITPEVYERIMGLDFQTSLDHTLYLIDTAGPENILIRGVDDNWPSGEKQQWLKFWQDKKVQLEYLPPISRCGAIGRLLPGSRKGKKTVRLYGCRCHHPLVEMVILFDGRAVMCCQDMGRELIWGSVDQNGLHSVWNSSARLDALKQLYSGQPSAKTFLCSRCEQALGACGLVQALAHSAKNKIKPARKNHAAIF